MAEPFGNNQVENEPRIAAGFQDRVSVISQFRGGGAYEPLKPMDPEQLQSAVRFAATQAVDFDEMEFSPRRTLADTYFQGATRLEKVDGRSQIVVSAVRDAVKSVTASMARIFTQTDKVAEFYSDDEEDEKACSDMTTYCNSVFWKNGGYEALIQMATDSLKAHVGIIKVSLDEVPYTVHRSLPKDESGKVVNFPGAQITEENDQEVIYTISKTRKKWKLTAVPGDEFIIDALATSIETARLHGHRRNVMVSEVIAMGFTYEEAMSAFGYSDQQFQPEIDNRRQYAWYREDDVNAADPLSRQVLFSELYMRIDADGDGIAELRRFACLGEQYLILSDEPVNWSPFAVAKAELQPHVFYPVCLAEDLIEDQDAQTALLRGIIDNTALVNTPRTEVNEQMVNIDDVKNGKIGAVVRVRQMGQINELTTPFVAGQTLPVLVHLQDVAQSRSGVTKLSQGLDPDQLQSTTRVAAAAAIAAADARIEMMARNVAQTGVKELFLCILRTAIHTFKGQIQVKIKEGYLKVRPEWWHDQVSVRVNVGLGSGGVDEKKMVFGQILPLQLDIVKQYGPNNPICSWENVQNTIRAAMRLSGIHNTTEFFPYVAGEMLAQLDTMEKQAKAKAEAEKQGLQQLQNQVMITLAQAEKQKSELKYASDMADMRARLAALQQKQVKDVSVALMQDDRDRDKMQLDFIAKMIDLGQQAKEIQMMAEQAQEQSDASK